MLMIGTTTVPSRAEAELLANTLISNNLSVCVQIDGPITSVYRWQGKVEQSEEFRLTIKFLQDKTADLEAWLDANHPYDTPEWVVVHVDKVAEKYLSWARSGSTSAPL